jgi:DNA-binding GntR family transcriptional regulator
MARASRSTVARKKKTAPPAANGHRGQGILQSLRQRILDWHYPPGCHLGEQALCEEFRSSRIPVREALRALAEQGLVDKVPNQGCYVKQPDVDGIHHLYDLRLALELFVVERLAQIGPPADLVSRVKSYWEPLLHIRADEPADGDMLVRADEEFHLGLALAVGNPYIVDALKDINERLRFVRLVVITTPHRVQATAGEHLNVLEALVKKNVEAARRAIRQNIDHARNKVEIALMRALTNAHQRGVAAPR